MTLREAMYEHIYANLSKCSFNRTKTAKVLDISVRGLRNYLNEMTEKGYAIEAGIKAEEDWSARKIFASNAERLSHADYMINKK